MLMGEYLFWKVSNALADENPLTCLTWNPSLEAAIFLIVA